MASYFCVYCKLPWPHEDHYRTCPQCREPTRAYVSGDRRVAMHPGEARSREARSNFGWWLLENGRL